MQSPSLSCVAAGVVAFALVPAVGRAAADPPAARATSPTPAPPARATNEERPATATPGDAAKAPTTAGGAAGRARALGGEGPVEFRCDDMQVLTKPNRAICVGNVVVSRGAVLLCCNRSEATSSDKGQLERLICKEDVRAQRADEIMWAERAEFVPASGELILTGRPLVRRGASILEGDRIVANVNDELARVDKPRARLVTDELRQAAPPGRPASASTMRTCPLPPPPRR